MQFIRTVLQKTRDASPPVKDVHLVHVYIEKQQKNAFHLNNILYGVQYTEVQKALQMT